MKRALLAPADQARLDRLRRMKAVALALLLLAAVIFLLTLNLDHSGFWGYVNTGAEAAMVGGLADWFAVTALFRHPLGIPIRHTAIIPTKKDQVARSLQDFFTDNFLTEQNVRDRLADARVAVRIGHWLGQEQHSRRAVTEALKITRTALGRVSDEEVRALAEEVILPRLVREPMADVVGNLVSAIVDDGAHRSLVDLLASEVQAWLEKNPEKWADIISDRAPRWAPGFVNRRVVTWSYEQALDWVNSIRVDRFHPTRRALDDLILRIARDLQTDSDVQRRAEALKERLLSHPQIGETVLSLWRSLRNTFTAAMAEQDTGLFTRAQHKLQWFGRQLQSDAILQTRVDGAISDAATFFINNYGSELSAVIGHTIERWDGREASHRIELHVGRDLQFIRINGTIVGALAGLVIHGVSQLL